MTSGEGPGSLLPSRKWLRAGSLLAEALAAEVTEEQPPRQWPTTGAGGGGSMPPDAGCDGLRGL